MSRPRIDAVAGADAVAASRAGAPPRETLALAVRYLLQVLTDVAPAARTCTGDGGCNGGSW